MQAGSQSTSAHTPATAAIPSIVPLTPSIPRPTEASSAQSAAAQAAAAAARLEQADFVQLKALLDAYARAHGFANEVQTMIDRRGLVVRVLTDRVLFDSGQADLKGAGLPLLDEVANLLNVDRRHPIIVEGHTDDIPIDSTQFPTNWELSTARATTVVRYLIGRGVDRQRLGAAGYADLHPVASNATAAGRALNRRVELVLQRLNPAPAN